jgi:hypothetical protein
MVKSTKFCEVNICMLSGVRLKGKFHVEALTSSSVRPSDAFQEQEGDYLLLSDVTVVQTDGQAYQSSSVLVRGTAISHVELPKEHWVAR